MEQLIAKEKFTSIQKAQAGLTRLLQEAEAEDAFYRVLRNNEPVGVLFTNKAWEGLLEDLEALLSESYLKRVSLARRQRRVVSLPAIKRRLKIPK